MIKKINNVIKHPNPFRKIISGMKNRMNRIIGRIWCRAKCISLEEFFKNIGLNDENISFYRKHEVEINEAQRKVDSLLIKMGGAGNLELLYRLTSHLSVARIIETGVAYGWSSLAFLLAMQESGGSGVLISTDLPYSKETERYVGWVVPEKLRGGWTIIRKADQSALPEVLSKLSKIDIAHYDSDKSYHGRMFGYAKLWSSLKPGGLLISDDVGDNLAFLRFARDVSERPMIVKKNKGCVGVLIKPEGNNV